MNKLVINEGGQPIYLDDIALVQGNSLALSDAILQSLTGKNVAYLMNGYDFSVSRENGEVRKTIPANSVVYQGEIIPFESASFVYGYDIKVCIKRQQSDSRTFGDGQQRYCREGYTAYLSTDDAGADVSFRIADMDSIPELIRRRVDNSWEDILFVPMLAVAVVGNRAGRFQHAGLHVILEFEITAEAWLDNETGLIGRIIGEDKELFAGKNKDEVIYSIETDSFYDIEIDNNGYVFLNPSDGGQDLPLTPIKKISANFWFL
jgi:hypothetical protein